MLCHEGLCPAYAQVPLAETTALDATVTAVDGFGDQLTEKAAPRLTTPAFKPPLSRAE